MGAIQVFDFDGRAITAFWFRGRECWVAQDVARVLGYDLKGWSTSWRRWADGDDAELRTPGDFEVLRGSDLREFLVTAGSAVAEKTRNLTILYESGLHLVCVKTEKPLGRRLRRFLADVMLPRLREASESVAAMRAEVIALSLRLEAGDNSTIWEAETVQDLCRLYRKPLWAPGERMPLWLKQPMGAIYRIVLGDAVYRELKKRTPDPHDGALNYQFLTEARHKLMQRDMLTVAAFLRVSRTPDGFFDQLRAVYRRAPLQLSWGT